MCRLIVTIAITGASLAWLTGCKPFTIEGELAKAPPEDRQALDAVLEGSGLSASQLTPIGAGVARGFGVLDRHQLAVAVEDGHIVELRLSDVPLPHPEAVTRLTGLQALSLSGNHLIALPDLTPLKDLVFLDVSQNELHDLAFLSGLVKLKTLNLAGNRIPDLKPLASLPALTNLNGRDIRSVDASDTKPPNWVQKAPPAKGKAGASRRDGIVRQGAFSITGTCQSLTGAVEDFNIPGYSNGGAGGVTVEISVEKGRVRAYLQYVPSGDKFFKVTDGYIFAEAQPGKPGKAQGILPKYSGDTYSLLVESVDGEAQGIRYRLYR
jgi:hypothetical protein